MFSLLRRVLHGGLLTLQRPEEGPLGGNWVPTIGIPWVRLGLSLWEKAQQQSDTPGACTLLGAGAGGAGGGEGAAGLPPGEERTCCEELWPHGWDAGREGEGESDHNGG